MEFSQFIPALFRIVVALLMLGALAGIGWILYWLATLPSRRRERARQFISLLQVAVDEGRAPDQVLVSAAHSLDPELPVRLQLLVAYLEEGLSLTEAIEQVPSLLPPNIRAMIEVGLRQDQLAAVLPAARRVTEETLDPQRGGLAAVLTGLTVPTLIGSGFVLMISINVLPKFRMLANELNPAATPLPRFTQGVFDFASVGALVLLGLVPILLGVLFGRTAGSRLGMVGLDALRLLLPWNRLRARRDFAGLLALQLDAGVREADAVERAARATGNRRIQRRAQRALGDLAAGKTLPEALTRIDSAPGFNWRLRSALGRPGSISVALHHWILDLDEQARARELVAGQLVASGILLTHATIIAAVVVAIFLTLIHFIEGALQ